MSEKENAADTAEQNEEKAVPIDMCTNPTPALRLRHYTK